MLLAEMPPPAQTQRFNQAEIGMRIRRAREKAGLSASRLGELVGISEDSMLKKEKGVAPFYFPELSRICDVLRAPTLFPVLEWDTAWLVERLLPPQVRAATADPGDK